MHPSLQTVQVREVCSRHVVWKDAHTQKKHTMEESSLLVIIASCENRGGGVKNLRQCWFDKKSYWASRKHVSTDMEVIPKQKFCA